MTILRANGHQDLPKDPRTLLNTPRDVEALKKCGHEFAYVNVLMDPEIFQNLPRYADWPTFPQVYIKGELIGGCDITLEMAEKGELQEMIKQAVEG